ncbi:hypothetical protein MSG28_005721 [Choristoneura fumiferana]|uniref:Uncharacterized protein n=2 Tax=Choristoneura fumiferana TaxID=7141 RepID=A0ACC0L008_CHOFU|nr:hypothetical protein MSG28_005721 [Choristoneura fumiferana]
MDQKPLHEISKRSIVINKSEEPSFSWQNSFLTVRSEKGLNLLYFSHGLQCIDKQIDWCVISIPSPKHCPATSLFSSKFKRRPMKNFEYEQMTMQPSLWPHNPLLVEELASIIAFEWSPPDFIYNNESILAILTNVGNVELYGPRSCGFKSIFNISSVIEEKFKDNSNSLPRDFGEFKKRVTAVVTTAMCWGNEHNCAFNFVTAQKNGDVHFWKLKCEAEVVHIDLLTTLDTKSEEIVMMKWIPLSNEVFFLIMANESGQLFVYKYLWECDNLKLVNVEFLWSSKDRFVVKHMKYSLNGDNIVIICNKQRHLLVLLVDVNCNKISERLYNINDHKITSISENNKEIYVTTINSNVYKVVVTISGENIGLDLTPVLIKENYANKELYGVLFSNNKMICALALVDRKLMYRKENITVDIVFLTENVNHENEISCLLTNPKKRLTEYNDCIEMLRYKTMKLKTLPSLDYLKLYSNSTNNLAKMKVYHILLILYNSLDKILRNGSKGWLPETSLEIVREKILALHAIQVMRDLYIKVQNGECLDGLKEETFVATKKYIKYYCQKHNVALTDLVSSDIMEAVQVDHEYTCQCCDKVINGFSCADGHLNMFCALTLTPIESDTYLTCKRCGILARIELLEEKPLCVFCDAYLNYYSLPS